MHKRQHARWPWLAAFAALAIVLTGAIAAAGAAGNTSRQGVCASIEKNNVEKQMNAHAALILAACGRTPAGAEALNSSFSSLAHLRSQPQDYGGTDVNIITGGEGTSPHVVQSETQVWANGDTVVSTYNDSRTAGACYSGGSYSQNGGATWTNLNSRPFCSGHGTSFGDPTIVYDALHAKWIASFLAAGCGGQGLGVWTSNDGATWATGPCAHSGGSDDRNSSWVDNTPSSPFYGRTYISWNNFAVGQGALQVIWSNDGGATWTAPVTVVGNIFVRDVQITTGADGKVFLATMNEGGGGMSPRQNIIQMSTNGGASWSGVRDGPDVPGPGRRPVFVQLVLREHVSVELAAHGLGRRPRRSGQRRALRLRPARCWQRQGRHLLRSLHRQRRDLEHPAPDRRRRWDARTVAAVARGHAGRARVRQLVRPAQHGEQRPAALRPPLPGQRSHLGGACRGQRRDLPIAADGRSEHPAVLHGRLRPLLRHVEHDSHDMGRRPCADQRRPPAGRLLRPDHDGRAATAASSAAASATPAAASATSASACELHGWSDHDQRRVSGDSLPVDLRRVWSERLCHRRQPRPHRPQPHLPGRHRHDARLARRPERGRDVGRRRIGRPGRLQPDARRRGPGPAARFVDQLPRELPAG